MPQNEAVYVTDLNEVGEGYRTMFGREFKHGLFADVYGDGDECAALVVTRSGLIHVGVGMCMRGWFQTYVGVDLHAAYREWRRLRGLWV